MKKFTASYVYSTAFLSVAAGGFLATINLFGISVFLLMIAGAYVYSRNKEREFAKRTREVKK